MVSNTPLSVIALYIKFPSIPFIGKSFIINVMVKVLSLVPASSVRSHSAAVLASQPGSFKVPCDLPTPRFMVLLPQTALPGQVASTCSVLDTEGQTLLPRCLSFLWDCRLPDAILATGLFPRAGACTQARLGRPRSLRGTPSPLRSLAQVRAHLPPLPTPPSAPQHPPSSAEPLSSLISCPGSINSRVT